MLPLRRRTAAATRSHDCTQHRSRGSHRTNVLSSDMAAVAESSNVSVPDQRLPSRRPIDHRWDASRGLTFNNEPRTVRRDYSWSSTQGIVFSDLSSSKRHYAVRGLRGQPVSRPYSPADKPPEATVSPSAAGGSLLSSSERLMPPKVQKKLAENAELKQTIKDRDDTIEALKAKIGGDAKRTAAKDGEIRKANERVATRDRKLATIEKQLREEQAAEVDGERRRLGKYIQQLESALKTSKAGSQEAQRHLEIEKENVRKRDDQIRDLNIQHRNQMSLQREQLDEQDQQRKEQRKTYDLYQGLFDDVADSWHFLTKAGEGALTTQAAEASVWQEAVADYDAFCASQSHTWFAVKHAVLSDAVKQFLEISRDRSEQTAQDLKRAIEGSSLPLVNFRKVAHDSRTLTRPLRYDEPTKADTVRLTLALALERPINRLIDRLRSSLGTPSSAGYVRRSAQVKEMGDVRGLLFWYGEMERFEELKRDSPAQRQRFTTTVASREEMDVIRRKWEQVRPSTTGDERNDMRNADRKHRNALREYEVHVSKRTAIEQELEVHGPSAEDADRYIDERIARCWEQIERCSLALKRVRVEERQPRLAIRSTDRTVSSAPTARSTSAGSTLPLSQRSEEQKRTVLNRELGKLKTAREEALSNGLQSKVVRIDVNIQRVGAKLASIASELSKRHGESTEPVRSRGRTRPFPRRIASPPRASGGGPSQKSFKPTGSNQASLALRPTLLDELDMDVDSTAQRLSAKLLACGFKSDALAETADLSAAAEAGLLPQAYGDWASSSRAFSSQSATSPVPSGESSSVHNDVKVQQSDEASQESDKTTSSVESSDVESSKKVKEEHVPLTYQIPKEDFKTALMSSQNSGGSFWKYSLYRSPSGAQPLRHMCRNFEVSEKIAKEFVGQPLLGFDIEWEIGAFPGRSSIKDNVSLIQIACEDRIALFQLALFKGDTIEELMPPTLRNILESPEVTKAGVNIAGDFTRMKKCLNVEGRGLFELSHLYKVVMFSEQNPAKVNRTPINMAKQVQDILHLPLFKGDVRTSAWSQQLKYDQITYAASDAYAGFRLYDALEAKRKDMDPTPPRPAFYEERKPLILGDGTVVQPKTRPQTRTETAGKASTEDTAESEDEDFYDALEHLDVDGFTPQAEQAADSAVVYPSLPDYNAFDGVAESDANPTAAADSAGSTEKSGLVAATSQAKTSRPPIPASSEIEQADAWVTHWRTALPPNRQVKAKPAALRAYSLWHCQSYDIQAVASLLREPPLQATTVASYVLEALVLEDLPHDVERAREALKILPAVAHRRYPGLKDRIGV